MKLTPLNGFPFEILIGVGAVSLCPFNSYSSHAHPDKNNHLKTAQAYMTSPPTTANFLEVKLKKVCVCVCVKKEMKGAATAHLVEKDITQSSVFQNAELFGRGFALSQKARQAPAY